MTLTGGREVEVECFACLSHSVFCEITEAFNMKKRGEVERSSPCVFYSHNKHTLHILRALVET